MNNYDDIINLPYYKSNSRLQMDMQNRAAQFAPFSALTGYEEKIRETARFTKNKIELDDCRKEHLNNLIQCICKNIKEQCQCQKATITYFVPDQKKCGGEYKTIPVYIKRVDETNKLLILDGKGKILISNIIDIQYENALIFSLQQ